MMRKVTPMKNQKNGNVRVMYKLKVSEDPISVNMPHKKEFDGDNYESIKEKETEV